MVIPPREQQALKGGGTPWMGAFGAFSHGQRNLSLTCFIAADRQSGLVLVIESSNRILWCICHANS